MKKEIRTLAALLIASATFVACSDKDDIISENQQPANPTGKYTMTVNASKGGGAQTRALSLDGKTLNVKWAATDQVAVYTSDFSATLGTLNAAASNGGSTTLTGTFDAATAPAVGDNLQLLFPRATWDYTGQTGVLLSDENAIEKKYDYALAGVTVNEVEDYQITTTGDANFQSQQAIVKFTLKDKDGDDLPVTSLTISAAGGKLVQSRAYDAGWTPRGCEDYNNTAKPYYLYLELPFEADEGFDILTTVDYKDVFFELDTGFGTDGCKVVDGKYIYRFNSANEPGSTFSFYAGSSSHSGLYATNVPFNNGYYYTCVDDDAVSSTKPVQDGIPGIQSTYGPLTVAPASATNTLTVALRNELGTADTYTLTAIDNDSHTCFFEKSGVTFENGKYYEITVKMNYIMAAYANAGDVGKLICTDGHIHAYNANPDLTACTKNRVAKIIYVGSNTDNATYKHGLALALTDGGDDKWSSASNYCSDLNTNTRVVDATWMLPSQNQLTTMISEAGGNTALCDGFASVGGTNIERGRYWSSTKKGESNAYYYNFFNGGWFYEVLERHFYFRACLVF